MTLALNRRGFHDQRRRTRMRAIELTTQSGEVLALRVAPTATLLPNAENQTSLDESDGTEIVRDAQRVCHVMTVTGRSLLMPRDIFDLTGSQIQVPVNLDKYRRLPVYDALVVGGSGA